MLLSALAILSSITALYVWYKLTRRSPFDHIPGPPSKSFLLGNLGELMQAQVGSTDFAWQETYGDVVKFKAAFGIDRFLISDPKALHHILQTSGYRWGKYRERVELSRLMSGKGLTYAEGNAHKRQRKIMLPGFGSSEAGNFLPLFFSCAASMSRRWSDILSFSENQSHVFNLPEWISRASLDAIGQAAFDYNFGATANHETELGKVYQNMLTKAFAAPSNSTLLTMELLQFLPRSLLEFLDDLSPSPRLAAIRRAGEVANALAEELVSTKANALLKGEGQKDIMSLLVKANASESPKSRLTHTELISTMRVIIFAGFDTTSNTLAFLLYELARNPELQHNLRAEIRAAEKEASSRGESQITISDLKGMYLLEATIKETLRYHPVAPHILRTAKEDDILPISAITTTTGQVLTELPIPRGTRVILSIPAYNRNKKIFGDDAHMFNPYRWLELNHVVKNDVSLGPFANLATFSGGIRSCLGWRFAIIELQAFVVELLSKFEFHPTAQIEHIRREAAFAMVPTVEGELDKGSQLPLRVTFA
ncbi:hypothetical protein GYMLUDRAFT_47014 [Collybiopsis luxurians FD-317 M1]|uniref:Cytochrome P450 n=1 Tax=Collybiopsis luxurians FD-317 M1 TaxID=944289 RepID=A0A0D0BNE2_9AGAR|nr:hypothetical protein GYMLUDRAFT_47014 [Collybiopsis luxurians FD-317 M1]